MKYTHIDSPLGKILLYGDEAGLHGVALTKNGKTPKPLKAWQEDKRAFTEARGQFKEYFSGTRRRFELPLVIHGTPFQESVWQGLRKIPYGKTWSYAALAKHIGKPSACRAVGAANGRNPLAIVVPCHRVIGADGSMTGYAGGMDNKIALLRLEGAQLAPPRQARLV